MELEFKFGDAVHMILLEPEKSSDDFKVVLDGKPDTLQISKVSPHDLILVRNGRIGHVYVAADVARIHVHVNGRVVRLEQTDSDKQNFSRDAIEFGSRDQIMTPMPGKIVKILVKEGERVTAKQSLVIVESMKMENELKSPANGTVKSIHFASGDLIGTDQPIIKIEPDQ